MSARRRAFLLLTAAAALVVVMAAVLPFLLLAGPARLADYAHRELVLRVVAERAAAGATTTSERAMAPADYLHANLYIFPGIEILEENLSRDPLFYLVRSIGWCDQQAGVLVALARKLGIDGALLDLEPSTDPARHVVALLDIGGVYRVFDPYYGIVFTRADGEPATLDDLRSPARPVSDQYDAIVQFVRTRRAGRLSQPVRYERRAHRAPPHLGNCPRYRVAPRRRTVFRPWRSIREPVPGLVLPRRSAVGAGARPAVAPHGPARSGEGNLRGHAGRTGEVSRRRRRRGRLPRPRTRRGGQLLCRRRFPPGSAPPPKGRRRDGPQGFCDHRPGPFREPVGGQGELLRRRHLRDARRPGSGEALVRTRP
ncbi:MAG: transglutaminase-like domain-containing protein [Gammaproteobacteria bacterium]|nr:transglutaminase-like domain-containing protein [Gammaproteobacteria bacterium]